MLKLFCCIEKRIQNKFTLQNKFTNHFHFYIPSLLSYFLYIFSNRIFSKSGSCFSNTENATREDEKKKSKFIIHDVPNVVSFVDFSRKLSSLLYLQNIFDEKLIFVKNNLKKRSERYIIVSHMLLLCSSEVAINIAQNNFLLFDVHSIRKKH